MLKPLRWLLAIIAVAAGLFFIVMSFGEGVVGGAESTWIDILIGLVLIVAALVIRPK